MRFRDHPLHPVLGIAPLALLAASVALDLGALFTNKPAWHESAGWCLGAAALSGTIVALLGIFDAYRYPAAARSVPFKHGIINGTVILLAACAWWLRAGCVDAAPSIQLLAMSFAAAVLAVIGLRIGRRLTR